MNKSCKDCQKEFSSANCFVNHVRAFHKLNETFICGNLNCRRSFTSFHLLKRHVLMCKFDSSVSSEYNEFKPHTVLTNNIEAKSFSDAQQGKFCSELSVPLTELYSNEGTEGDDSSFHPDETFDVMKFLSKLYSNKTVCRSLVQDIADYSAELISNIFSCVKEKLAQHISGLPQSDVQEINNILSSNPFLHLKTEYQRFRYLETKKFLVKPVSYLIGEMLDNKFKNGDVTVHMKQCRGQYIPARHILKQFFELPAVYDEMMSYVNAESNSDYMSSIFNSPLWKNVAQSYKNKIVLPLLIYFDDFETSNPLGSHAGIHKVGAVYFSLPSIPPQFQQKLHNMFLFGLFYSTDRTMFSNRATFKPFIKELLYLATEGLNINVSGVAKTVYFVAPVVLGDNLGLNSVLGFSESFSAKYYCRVCYADKSLCQFMTREDPNLIRCVDSYERHLSEKSHGIKEYCIWNDLPYYHNTTNVTCDIMHDLYEGICRYDMAKILKNFIFEKKIFTVSDLNTRIKYFDFQDGVDVGNAIPLINAAHIEHGHIIMSSAEMHCFVKNFPILVGDLVDESDEVWHFFLLLFKIIEILSQAVISEDMIIHLDRLITEHNRLFIELFESHLLPKFHFLIHYPNIIRNVGPLVNFSSIRFEAFHKVAKTNAHIVTSRVNIPYTLALKHQLILAHRFVLQIGFLNDVTVGPFECSLGALNLPHITNQLSSNLNIVKYVKRNGILYKPELVFRIGEEFVVVKHILYENDESVFFIYEKLCVYGYDDHFAAYELNPIKQNRKYFYTRLFDFIPIPVHKSGNGNFYVCV